MTAVQKMRSAALRYYRFKHGRWYDFRNGPYGAVAFAIACGLMFGLIMWLAASWGRP